MGQSLQHVSKAVHVKTWKKIELVSTIQVFNELRSFFPETTLLDNAKTT